MWKTAQASEGVKVLRPGYMGNETQKNQKYIYYSRTISRGPILLSRASAVGGGGGGGDSFIRRDECNNFIKAPNHVIMDYY